jgi:hypothetical protein
MHYAEALIETWLRGGLEIGGRRQRVKPGDIAVLYPRRRPDAAVSELRDRLNGFTRAVLPAGDKPTGTLRDEAVKILPMHSGRGLQFRIVLLLRADQLPSPFKSRDDVIDRGPTLCRHDSGRGHVGDPAFRQLVLCRGALPRVGNSASVAARRSGPRFNGVEARPDGLVGPKGGAFCPHFPIALNQCLHTLQASHQLAAGCSRSQPAALAHLGGSFSVAHDDCLSSCCYTGRWLKFRRREALWRPIFLARFPYRNFLRAVPRAVVRAEKAFAVSSTRRRAKRGPTRSLSSTVSPTAQGDRSRDAILGDHLLIKLEAEAWARRHWHEAVLEPRPVRPHGLPYRIAVGIGEALEKSAVRHGGD